MMGNVCNRSTALSQRLAGHVVDIVDIFVASDYSSVTALSGRKCCLILYIFDLLLAISGNRFALLSLVRPCAPDHAFPVDRR